VVTVMMMVVTMLALLDYNPKSNKMLEMQRQILANKGRAL
jgi:hypothetical protein